MRYADRCENPFRFLLTIVGVIAITAPPSHAATFTVDSTVDAADAAPLDGTCATAAGACTLRAAVQTANALAGADVIVLPAGTYTLTIAGGGEDQAAQGDLDVRDDVTIAGADAVTTIIDGGGVDRVLHALNVTLTIRDLTIRNGTAAVPQPFGGGIYAIDATLLLERTIVTQTNGAGSGGGGVYLNGGSLEVRASTITDNDAHDGAGGGIYVLAVHTAATCLVTDSTISDNRSQSLGGGIFANSVFAVATLTVRRTTIAGNTAYDGSAIALVGAAVVDESTMVGNTASHGSAISTNAGTLTLTRSTVAGNSGGGVSASGAGLIENTTISGNTGSGLGGGGTGLRVRNVTVTGNTGGGFSGSNEISNSIVAGNVNDGDGEDCSGTITSGGYNLIERAEACVITGDITGNVLGLPAALGPLAMNGGPTATHALLPGSPALDAGNPAPTASAPPACAPTDQRSAARPYANACDMGAVEQTYAITACGNGVIDAGEQCDDGNVRDGDCCTSTCQLAAAGALCTDGNICTDDVCDGAGACVATNNTVGCTTGVYCTVDETCSNGACGGGTQRSCDDGVECSDDVCHPTYGCIHFANDSACSDTDPCTTDVCEMAFPPPFGVGIGCSHSPATGPTCDDGNVCTTTDTCQVGTCVGHGRLPCDDCFACDPDTGCTILGPEPTCTEPLQPRASVLQLKDAADDAADSLKWTWKVQDATNLFGSPTTSTTYDLCIYDESSGTPSLLLHATPAVGMCGTVPCWKTKPNGHIYKDRAGTGDGLTNIKLRSSYLKTQISLKGKGANLPPLGLPYAPDPAIVAQLRSSVGGCWGASFGTAIRNTSEQFKAKSD